ncbi:Hypothetical protein PENO1_102990 [Penicillium occitanis (nom. inval.)]|nr:Hypothetical protein PENO1_102990 [Penicillium occitanis (nom. inval.)]PCG93848.1 hypothetical protein PENOC_085590 [Penicillium occitanis (nom. inval.)]
MLSSFVRGFALIVLLSSVSVSQAEIINWDVAAGKCTDDDLKLIDVWFNDANSLLTAALQAVGELDTGNEDILTFFSSYFGIQWDYSTPGAFKGRTSSLIFDQVRSTLNAMSTFMNSGKLSVGAAGSFAATERAPYGYCGVDNYQQWNWNNEAWFVHDFPVTNPVTGNPYSVQDVYGKAYSPNVFTPYWAETESAYLFGTTANPLCSIEKDEEQNEVVTMAFVARPNNAALIPLKGIADTTIFGPSINICNAMFDAEGLDYVESLADLSYPTADAPTMLDAKLPKGATIFHELTHLVTDYVGDQWYPLDLCIEFAVNQPTLDTISAQNNANSYMFFALAVWYYYNPPGDYVATFYRGTSNDQVHMVNS